MDSLTQMGSKNVVRGISDMCISTGQGRHRNEATFPLHDLRKDIYNESNLFPPRKRKHLGDHEFQSFSYLDFCDTLDHGMTLLIAYFLHPKLGNVVWLVNSDFERE